LIISPEDLAKRLPKPKFVSAMAKISGIPKYRCQMGLNVTIATLIWQLTKGHTIVLEDFGTFRVVGPNKRLEFTPSYGTAFRIRNGTVHVKKRGFTEKKLAQLEKLKELDYSI